MKPLTPTLALPNGNAICYSGYRHGQSPADKTYPSKAEILEDLHILQPHWQLLRLYDCSLHGERVLEVIRDHGLPFQVLLGAHLGAEASNPDCPWGASFSDEQLAASRAENDAELDRLVSLANRFDDIVFAVAVGNEATVDWTDHLVPVERMIELVRQVKARVAQPVTFCENYVPWLDKLAALADELDFISVHTYPLWEYKSIEDAMTYTRDNVDSVARRHPGKTVVITEAGWTTRSNGRGMNAACASQAKQAVYCRELLDWAAEAGILCFVFEAFDEPWKGSPDPLEPEKHWGLYTVERQPKIVVQALAAKPAETAEPAGADRS
jgi:exo-beta-1,3-glucanase (GH17 family)